ncbi:unnamed protein product, partial [Miscanthus lutarioriparius]
YAHWRHLLRPIYEDSHLIPDEYRVGRASLAWVRWFSAFIEPFNSILHSLGQDNLYDPISFGARQCDYHIHPGLAPRNLSSRDLTVVQRVAEEHLQDYLVSIMNKEMTNNDHWKRELHNLLGVQVDYQGQTAMERDHFETNPVAGPSSQPVLLDNLLAKENLIDNQIIVPVENNKKRHPPLNILSRDNGDPPAKRRLDFTDMDEGCGPAIALVPNVTPVDEDPNQEDEDYTVITDFGIVDKKGNLQPLPSIESYITTTRDCGQQLDHPSSGQALSKDTQSMDATEIEKIFLATAYQVSLKVLNGLDVTTLKDPERCAALQLTSTSLPGNFASISKIKAMLDKLVAISQQLQLAHSEFEASSGRVDQAVGQEMISVEERKAELLAEVAKFNLALKELEEKEEKLLKTQSAQELEVKEQEQALCDATTKANKRANDDLRAKTMVPIQEAELRSFGLTDLLIFCDQNTVG